MYNINLSSIIAIIFHDKSHYTKPIDISIIRLITRPVIRRFRVHDVQGRRKAVFDSGALVRETLTDADVVYFSEHFSGTQKKRL